MGKISQVLTGFLVTGFALYSQKKIAPTKVFDLSLPSTPACFTSIPLRSISVSGFALYSQRKIAPTKVFDLGVGYFFLRMHASFFHVCELCIIGQPY